MSHSTTVARRSGLALWLGIAGAAALAFGTPILFAPSLTSDLGLASSALVVNGVLFVAGIVLAAAALVFSRAPKQARYVGATLVAGGLLVGLALFLVADTVGWRIALALAGVVVVGLVASGILAGLGCSGVSFAWLPLLLLPAVVATFVPVFGMLIIVELVAAVVAGLIVGLGALVSRR